MLARQEVLHGIGEVGVDDDGVGHEGAIAGTDTARFTLVDQKLFHRLIEQNFHAHLAAQARHGGGNRAASAGGMEDAVLVLEERENGKQRGAAKRAHAQVFGLKTEAEADPFVGEVGAEIAIKRGPRLEQREQLQHVRRDEIGPAFKARLKKRQKAGELFAVAGKEPTKRQGIVG